MFGSKPESFVLGAVAGWFDWSSTATTWGPAPIAKSISVEVAASETMRAGRAGIVTGPFEAFTVTGKDADTWVRGATPGLSAHAAKTSASKTMDADLLTAPPFLRRMR